MTGPGVLTRTVAPSRRRRGTAILASIVFSTVMLTVLTGLTLFWVGEAGYQASLPARARLSAIDLVASQKAVAADDGSTSADHLAAAVDAAPSDENLTVDTAKAIVTIDDGARCQFVTIDRDGHSLGTVYPCP